MKYDVFISYSSIDQKVAEGVCGYLESQGIRCFVAYRDIPRGVVWAREIANALDDSQMMVVIFSESFNKSDQVDREIELASENKMPILTFRISDTAFTGAKKYYLKNLNWIDAFPNPQEAFGSLCDNVKRLIAPQVVEVSTPSAPVVTPKTAASSMPPQVVEVSTPSAPVATPKTAASSMPPQVVEVSTPSAPVVTLKTAASSMTPQQMYEKGEDYYYGQNGCPQNYAEAVKWYRKAAEQGHADAQCDLGYRYKYGLGVVENKAEAVKWFRRAAEQGHADAQYNLGNCYNYGWGVDEDKTEAVKWYRKAAEQGDVDAQNNLGDCYNYGWGVAEDKTEAVNWYRKAAEQGDADAQCNLGYCYSCGEGVVEDKIKVVEWYRKAAEHDYITVSLDLRLWEQREAAEQGNADAQYYLGVCYDIGVGVGEDKTEAVRWYLKAAEQGILEAKIRLHELGA